jgi:hypothetical protein
LGSDPQNDLQWRNVYSDQGGDYTMTIKYISGENRNITVNVNGEDVKTLSCNSGNWNTVGSKALTISLEQGENVIRLYGKSSSAWMPNIDCMTLQPVGKSGRVVVGIEDVQSSSPSAVSTQDSRFYTLSGQPVSHPEKGIYIHKGRKISKK